MVFEAIEKSKKSVVRSDDAQLKVSKMEKRLEKVTEIKIDGVEVDKKL